eukprot:scaffold16104_cov47-Phaeocystis_antarctica.AAC.4
MPCFRLSAGRVGVQPAAELRHLQRHEHGLHVPRALLPVPFSISAAEPSPARCVHRGRPPPLACRPSHLSPHRTLCPPFGSRQNAAAFNQPLSLDTSSVTTMQYMFLVRSYPRARPCTLRAPPGSHLAPHRMPSVPLSAVRVGVQPAAELRHLQRHIHVGHALRALLPVPSCPESADEPSSARCVHRRRPPPFLPPGPNLAPHRTPPFRLSAVRVGVQPAAELRHLQCHEHELHVPRALLPVPCPKSAVEPSPLRPTCTAVACHPPASRVAPRSAPHALLSNPRQSASALNQPLSFDTSSVTNMNGMFYVRSSPRPAPNLQSSPPLHAACPAVEPPPPAPPAWPAPCPAPYALLSTLGMPRKQTPCPTPTSCSFVARGRAPRPSPPLDMARAGVRGPARPLSQPRPPW